MDKKRKISCPLCQKPLEIPVFGEKSVCPHCGTGLIRTNHASITQVLEAKDEIDALITKKTMFNLAMELDTTDFVFEKDETKKGRYAENLMNIAQSLMKANSHRRKYINLEETEINSLISDNTKSGGHTAFISSKNPIELNSEFDALLTQIKAALDSLAKITNPLFGFNLLTWKKVKDENGVEKSGLKVIRCLKGLPEDENKEKRDLLVKFLEDNIDWVTYIVKLRDNPVHWGKTIATNLSYNPITKKVTPQLIIHGPNSREFIKNFMERIIREIVEFIHIFLLLSINYKAKHGLQVAFDKDGKAGWNFAYFQRKQF